MITLKVIDTGDALAANTLSIHGGVDLTPAHLFNHLFPEGFCPWVFRELLYDLARAHGWNVEITRNEKA
jgi:hypothetical protein